MLIEQFVLEYLQDKLDMDEIYVQLPETFPDQFAVLTVTDRGKKDQINAVTMEIQSYGSTKYKAACMDELIRDAMEAINEEDCSCRYGGGNDNPDTTIKMPRYRSYFNIFY